MSLLLWIGLGFAGGCGALARWLLDTAIKSKTKKHPETGIVVVNILACFIIGFGAGFLLPGGSAYQIVATGFLGGFSTFSTHIVDIVKLMEVGKHRKALVLLFATLFASILAAALGFKLGRVL